MARENEATARGERPSYFGKRIGRGREEIVNPRQQGDGNGSGHERQMVEVRFD
jgi:hypothetical protein